MAQKKLREPKVPRLFRWWDPERAAKLEARRFSGLTNREGVLPSGVPSLDSLVEYYTEKDHRNKNTVGIVDLEAKSAKNDRALKRFGTGVFFLMAVASIAAIGFNEVRSMFYPDAEAYKATSIALYVLILLVINLVLFGWMYNNFTTMDHAWHNHVDSFFARSARAQMEAVRDCMREFKRFVKWRRYMRLMMWAAGFVLVAQVAILLVSESMLAQLPFHLTWSEGEMGFSMLFIVFQFLWLSVYSWMWVYYTTFRDPTLQLCVLVNVMDRATVLTPTIATQR